MKNHPYKHKSLASLVSLSPLIFILLTSQAEATNYQLHLLDKFSDSPTEYRTAPIAALNNQDQAVSYVGGSNGDARAAIWRPSGSNPTLPTELGGIGGITTTASAINNAGHAVGNGNTSTSTIDAPNYRALYWDGTHPVVTLSGLPVDNVSIANGINDHEQIVGFSVRDNVLHANYWSNPSATVQNLATLGGSNSAAQAINNAGQIVGNADTRGDVDQRGAFWNSSNSTPIALGSLGGGFSSAVAINDAGKIVGSSNLPGDAEWRAVVWNDAHSAPINLGFYDFGLGSGTNISDAVAINNAGLVLGSSQFSKVVVDDQGNVDIVNKSMSFLWNGKQMVDVDSLLSAELRAAGWHLDGPTDINDQGAILGNFSRPNPNSPGGIESWAAILAPTTAPIPSAFWLFGSAFASLGVLRRRSSPPSFTLPT